MMKFWLASAKNRHFYIFASAHMHAIDCVNTISVLFTKSIILFCHQLPASISHWLRFGAVCMLLSVSVLLERCTRSKTVDIINPGRNRENFRYYQRYTVKFELNLSNMSLIVENWTQILSPEIKQLKCMCFYIVTAHSIRENYCSYQHIS